MEFVKLIIKSKLIEMNEKPEFNYLINTGFYIFKPDALEYLMNNYKTDMNQFIEKLKKNKKRIGVYQFRKFMVRCWPMG